MQFNNAICKYTIYRYTIYARNVEDKIFSEYYKYINVLLVNSSLVNFFFFIVNIFFITLSRLVTS